MQCSKCLSDIEVLEYQGIEIDRCTNCFGILVFRTPALSLQ
ncbi:MAG: zf-TFIIB domain-containing protein [Gammaproteobacteria bacterium]|nr:zf-TFIIB domain-containing protein [Gammaproteobacteria bacterium]